MSAKLDLVQARIDKAMREAEEKTLSGMPPEFSDDAMALEFAARAAHLRWSPGLGWMADDGVVWSRDDKLLRYDQARTICRDAAFEAEDEEGRRLTSARTVNAVLSLAMSDRRLVVPAEAWDCNPMILNTPNGIVQMDACTVQARGTAYVTQAARVTPSPGPAPIWHRFIQEVCCGDAGLIEFMQRSLGYCLTGDRREQVLFFWYGLGANGKSVLAELVQWIAGSYSVKMPATALMQAKGERHPTELAQLRGKRLAVSSELDESSFFNESLVKELTGDNTLTARFMRGDFFEFAMTQKHVIIGNFKPRLRGGDPAMTRRMLLVPFMASFKGAARDPHMLDKLKAEAPAILHWILQGTMAWSSEGLAIPAAVRDASADYMADHDDLALWIEECCAREGEARAATLYESFGRWKKARGEHAPSLTTWGPRLASVPGIGKRRSGGIWYTDISLTITETERLNGFR